MDAAHPQKCRVHIDLNHDCISNMPPEVKEKILVKLPINEAVRTSVLSKNWIDTWKSIPNFVFFERKSTEFSIIKLVDMVLLVHQGPIEKFSLVCNHACNGPIGRWMFILATNCIKDLELRFLNRERCKIPSRILSCNALEHLYLSGCSINVPQCFEGFKLMRTLVLSDFDSSVMSIVNLVLSCPLLQRLTLDDFTLQGYLRIFAPNLIYIYVFGEFGDICLETPELMSGYICLTTMHGGFHSVVRCAKSNITRALGRLSNIQKLEICAEFIEYLSMGPIPHNLPPIFVNLRELRVYVHISDDTTTSLCLFENAPNLEVLHIELWASGDEDIAALWKPKAFEDRFKRLEIVNVMYVHTELSIQNAKSILEFAKFVVSTAPVLVKLSFIDLEDIRVFLEMLKYSPKLSKKAEIVFVNKSDEE